MAVILPSTASFRTAMVRFSFALDRELTSLERVGYVQGCKKSLSLNPDTSHFARDEIARLSTAQMEAADEVVAKYGRMKPATLLRNVYERYPWYAQNSELADFVPDDVPRPPLRRPAAYTVGYEGKSVDSFFNDLLASGIGADPRRAGESSFSQVRVRQTLAEADRAEPGSRIPPFPRIGYHRRPPREVD